VVTAPDRRRHEVEYHRVEPGRDVARVSVQCLEGAGMQTEVRVAYLFVGLSEVGNRDIAAMSPEACEEKMRRRRGWIETSDHKRMTSCAVVNFRTPVSCAARNIPASKHGRRQRRCPRRTARPGIAGLGRQRRSIQYFLKFAACFLYILGNVNCR
jgi:hypothetical protein